MSHPRLTLTKPGQGLAKQIAVPVADLRRSPDGNLDCQLLLGAGFNVVEARDGWSYGQAIKDNYVGYIRSDHLSDYSQPTHKISTLSSHIYLKSNLKSGALGCLPYGAELTITQTTDDFCQLPDGTFIPKQHLKPLADKASDFVAIVEAFLGIPYLWGGNSTTGMDCSGTLQLALHAAGMPCPRDSDMQEADLGTALKTSATLQRGDLIFWRGHIGVMQNEVDLIHANAHHMAVASEPLTVAIKRISANNGGPVTAQKRL